MIITDNIKRIKTKELHILLPPFQIIRLFVFLDTIAFGTYLDTYYICLDV